MPVMAVIGASNDRRKYGNKALRAWRARGFTVVPVNPHEAEIEGERAYASVLDYPGPIDEATVLRAARRRAAGDRRARPQTGSGESGSIPGPTPSRSWPGRAPWDWSPSWPVRFSASASGPRTIE